MAVCAHSPPSRQVNGDKGVITRDSCEYESEQFDRWTVDGWVVDRRAVQGQMIGRTSHG